LSEFVFDLRRPNANYLNSRRVPLIERHPLLFWQCLCLFLACLVLVLLFLQYGR
jgi:hypothetical protein